MRIFVDETGAPGINGQDYFVLGAVIFSSSSDEQRCSQAIDALRQSLGKPPKFEFKYNKNPASIQRRFLETTLTADWRFAGFIHRKEEPKERVQDLSPSRLKEWSVYNLVWGIEDCTRYAEMILDEGMGTN